jgi:hypothetical protein
MSAAWRLRFNRELTDATLARARGYAEKLIARHHQVEGITDLRAPHDVVNQAVLDTMRGVRLWDPDREPPKGGLSLARHLCRVIYSRVNHDRERRKRQRALSFHERNLDIDSEDSVDNAVEVNMSLERDDGRQSAEHRAMLAEMRERVLAAVRDATDDDEVRRYVDFLTRGLKEGEMRREAGWDENAYNRVRRRFDTVVENLPARLLRDAHDLLARWPVRLTGTGRSGYRSRLALGEQLRKPKGTEYGAKKSSDDVEDDDAPVYGDDEDREEEPEAESQTDGDAEDRDDD